MKRLKKAAALLLAIIFATALLVSCTSAAGSASKPVDVETQRAQFEQMAQNRQVDESGGVKKTSLLETEGNMLVSADYPEVANQTITSELKAFVDQQVSQFKTEAGDMGEPDKQHGLYNFTLTYKPYAISNDLLGIKFTETAFSGKTDKKNHVQSFVYNLQSAQRTGLDSVFDSSQDYLSALSQKAQEILLRNEILQKNMDESLFSQGTAPTVQNFSNFAITPEQKIIFYFNKGTVAPPEAGSIELCMPLSELDSLLNPQIKPMILGNSQTAVAGEATVEGDTPAEGEAPTEGDTPAEGETKEVALNLFPEGDRFMLPHSIEGIDPNGKIVALTMDDGPSKNTPEVLDILKEENVKATFFIIGENIKGREETLKRTYDEGHEIATHSWDHTSYKKISLDSVMSDQIGKTNDAIEGVLGKRTIMDRPPYGAMDKDLANQIQRPQIMWTADTEDWKNKNVETSVTKAMNEMGDGGVILWHDLHSTAPGITKQLIKELKAKDYQFVTISQMMQIAKLRGDEVGYLFTRASGG